MISYEQMREEASSSDHGVRIISELEQAVKEALTNTPPSASALEIGNREGGSAAVILYYLGLENKGRRLVTVDTAPCPSRITRLAESTGTPHQHFQMTQEAFIKNDKMEWGFIFLDADHSQDTVTRDMKSLASRLAKGGIIVVDDVHEWEALPEIEGLKQTTYPDVNQGVQLGKHGQHVAYWRKS